MTDTTEARTDDPRDTVTLMADADRVLDCLYDGGVGLVPLDVAYAIIGARASAMRRIFRAKARSLEKPSGMFGHWTLSRRVHRLPAATHEVIEGMSKDVGLPFSVVAPFDAEDALFAHVDPFVLQSSSKAGTLDMLLNAGPLHNALALRGAERGHPVFGSSANLSLTGSKYRLSDIDAPVRQAADIALDYGISKYANAQGRSSTIIDFTDFTVIRIGVAFDALQEAFRTRFNIALSITPETAGQADPRKEGGLHGE